MEFSKWVELVKASPVEDLRTLENIFLEQHGMGRKRWRDVLVIAGKADWGQTLTPATRARFSKAVDALPYWMTKINK